jgi:hypothetical protein
MTTPIRGTGAAINGRRGHVVPRRDGVYALVDPWNQEYLRMRTSVDVTAMLDILVGGPVVEPVRLDQGLRGIPGSFAWFTMRGPVLVQESIVALWTSAGVTGWGRYPVEIHNKFEGDMSGYHGLSVSGRCGPIDRSRSQVVESLDGGRYERRVGLHWDPATWDGSDLFMTPSDDSWILMTGRVALLLHEHRARNYNWVDVSAIRYLVDTATS